MRPTRLASARPSSVLLRGANKGRFHSRVAAAGGVAPLSLLLPALLPLLAPGAAHAAPLHVGPGETYSAPCAAIAAAEPGDEVLVAPGTYVDSCVIDVPGLTLRGDGERPVIDLSSTDHPAQYKGIYVVTAADVTIENLELKGAHISPGNGENAAGIRVEAPGLSVRRCVFRHNQNGILGGTTGALTVEHSEFVDNGVGNGCNGAGCTHNLYIAGIDTLTFRFNWSHAIATDTADKGHLIKSRAKANYLLYNRFTSEGGPDSYQVNLPNGGLAVLVGNVIQKSEDSGNATLFSWGEEGSLHPDTQVFVVNNTFVNERGSGTFIRASGATLVAHNNLFAGAGTLSDTGELSEDNLAGVDPGFVDPASYDYHLTEGSPAIGHGIPVTSGGSISLEAAYEYVHPLERAVRASVEDVGAFEFGTDVTEPGDGDTGSPDADAGASDAGSNGSGDGDDQFPDAASAGDGDGAGNGDGDGDGALHPDAGSGTGGSSDGCAIGSPAAGGPACLGWALAGLWALRARGRRRGRGAEE
jgi:hypothetical protein